MTDEELNELSRRLFHHSSIDFVELALAFGRLQNEALFAEDSLKMLANANKNIFRNKKRHKKQIHYAISSRSMR